MVSVMNDYTLSTSSGYWRAGLMADNGKYAACKHSSERMRIGSDGSMGMGGLDSILERYDFDTYLYAHLFCAYAQEIEEAFFPALTLSSLALSEPNDGVRLVFNQPLQADYECLWAGISYRPTANKLPNWFARKMTEYFFGCKWKKVKRCTPAD